MLRVDSAAAASVSRCAHSAVSSYTDAVRFYAYCFFYCGFTAVSPRKDVRCDFLTA